MPRLSPVESQRSEHLTNYWSKSKTLLSPSRSKISDIDNLAGTSWEMCDDYRTDRFSENYYRHYWGLHKGGMVLGIFFGMILLVGGVVGAVFVG